MNDQALNLSNFFFYLFVTTKDRPKYSSWCYKQYRKYQERVWN